MNKIMNKKKKIFMSMVLSLAAVFTATAQDGNMALGCRATASTEAGSHTADKAVDGDAAGDSRWESLFNDVADADAQWWSVDLGEPREFDMIQIVWEGAYAKAFRIVVAGSDDFSDARTVIERDEMLTTLTQNYDLPEAVTARYIRFEGIERALPYGYSFYEFGVYKKAAPVLTTLTATPSAEMCRLGGSIRFMSTVAATQYGVKVREFAVYGRAVEGEPIASPEPDAATGATVLDGELNDATAAFFDGDNSTAYDMRSVNITAAMAITPVNPNAMFIVTPAQAGLLAGTPNLIIYNAGEYRAAGIVLTDGYDVNTRLAVKAAEVSYSRTAADGYQTLVVPFAAAVPAGMRAYALVDRTPAGILFQESLMLEASVPYLITGGTALSLSASDVLLDFRLTPNSGDDATFEGTYTMLQAMPGSYVLDGEGMFRRTADGATVPAFRAWLTLTDASAAKMAVVFGDATGISTPATAVTESLAYTLGGVKIPAGGKPLKGLIIENGRKTVKRQ